MKLKRGCGCLAFLLAGVNLLLIAGPIIGLARGTSSVSLSLLMMAIFAANAATCLLAGLQSLTMLQAAKLAESGEDEGVDEAEAMGEGEDQ